MPNTKNNFSIMDFLEENMTDYHRDQRVADMDDIYRFIVDQDECENLRERLELYHDDLAPMMRDFIIMQEEVMLEAIQNFLNK